MSTPDETPGEQPEGSPRPGNYGEIAPGVPRYGQYAPEGWQPPSSGAANTGDGSNAGSDAGTSGGLPPAGSYPGFQGARYPNSSFPQRGSGPVPRGEHFAAPRKVVLASRMIMGAGALQVVSGLLLLAVLFIPSAKAAMVSTFQQTMSNDPAYTQIFNDPALLNSVLVIATVISLLAAVSYFWLAAKIRRGANWARVTGLVLAIISLVGLVQPNFFSLLQIGLGLIAIIILFRSPAKEYFAGNAKGPRGY